MSIRLDLALMTEAVGSVEEEGREDTKSLPHPLKLYSNGW